MTGKRPFEDVFSVPEGGEIVLRYPPSSQHHITHPYLYCHHRTARIEGREYKTLAPYHWCPRCGAVCHAGKWTFPVMTRSMEVKETKRRHIVRKKAEVLDE